MELLLTGTNIPASEAASLGLVSRVVPDAEGQKPGEGVVAEAMKVAEVIAGKGRLSVFAVKEAVKMCEYLGSRLVGRGGRELELTSFSYFSFFVLRFTAQEVGLTSGLALERRLFQSLFSTEDQKEGESRLS